MHLLHGLALVAMEFSFHLRVVHMQAQPIQQWTSCHTTISHPSSYRFPKLTPNPIPLELAQLFLHQQPDWLSNTRRDNFKHFCQRGLPIQQPSFRTKALLAILPAGRVPSLSVSDHQLMLLATFLAGRDLS